MFHLNYWCNSQEEKEELKELFKENEIKYQAEVREKYNPDNIFKKTDTNTNIETYENDTNTALIEYKESFFTSFKNFIFKLLHINK